jgi:hypothetical protein
MRRSLLAFLAVAALSVATGNQALAQSNVGYEIDEFGNGFAGTRVLVPNPGLMKADPVPGGLASALTYSNLGPPSVVVADVLVLEPDGTTTGSCCGSSTKLRRR